MAREKLEEDLHSTKAQLKENHQGADGGVVGDGTPPGSEYNSHMNSEHDVSSGVAEEFHSRGGFSQGRATPTY